MTQLAPLRESEFDAFYEALHRQPPFQWQSRLAAEVCGGGWPDYIKLPTSSGKTAAIDIAVFALAFQAAERNRNGGVITTPRRIFFVVDRRIIVNEAYLRARAIAERLREAISSSSNKDSILFRVASWLQFLAGGESAPPLDCRELRGGIYRDDAWVRSPLQPTVLATTVDQVGSRMLFRGYGVSDRNLSIHAALTTNDTLVILDEAHCSIPFGQTMERVARYRGDKWAIEPVQLPFTFVQMTATPPAILNGKSVFALSQTDYDVNPLLNQRHACRKPVTLVEDSGAKGKSLANKLAKTLVSQANALVQEHGCKKVAIVVNRVAIAQEAFDLLRAKHPQPGAVSLMIGRMRPLDRDDLTKQLQASFASGNQTTCDSPEFVVATQCLEVGADFDFDGLVTQCSSLDSLRQRFGRLNRLGQKNHALGVIVAAEGDLQCPEKLDDEKPIDPIYGNALARTWHWLQRTVGEGREVDFGIQAMDTLTSSSTTDLQLLSAPSMDATVLMPAHIDMLCQTSPRIATEPDVAAYLHGASPQLAEVRVCWRADLELKHAEMDVAQPSATVDVCPPSSAECLTVPLPRLRQWLMGDVSPDMTSDVLGESADDSDSTPTIAAVTVKRLAFVYRGKTRSGENANLIVHSANARQLRPNDTVIIPASIGGWNQLGYIPDAPLDPSESDYTPDNNEDSVTRIDIADRAFTQNRARHILRVHPQIAMSGSTRTLAIALQQAIKDENADLSLGKWKRWIDDNSDPQANEAETDEPLQKLKTLKGKLVRYPGGVAWITELDPNLVGGVDGLPLASFGDDDDYLSQTTRLSLEQHLADVLREAARLTNAVSLAPNLDATIHDAARFHDLGKADPRFQAMLIGKPVSIAYMQPKLWAKSDSRNNSMPTDIPRGFRHEMLSVQLASRFTTNNETDLELLSHLIASHHGHARPLAPMTPDEDLPDVNLNSLKAGTVSKEEREKWSPAHRLNSGVGEGFWQLNRRFGWWGLAFLESTLRLADWTASGSPNHGDVQSLGLVTASNSPSPISMNQGNQGEVALIGIDGSNPLGFLAALGVFRTVAKSSALHKVRMRWAMQGGGWRPIVSVGIGSFVEDDLLGVLLDNLESDPDRHPAICLSEIGNSMLAFAELAFAASRQDRENADWASCNGSDAVPAEAISQLQTSRRDYHSINVRGLVADTNLTHLQRSLFQSWDYSDPIAGASLHLEPREDRRHAYQWHTPSGDPTRKSSGGMMGANRLALEAWPLFQSLPHNDRLVTTGFKGVRASNTQLTWPIWTLPISIDLLASVLSLKTLQMERGLASELASIGIGEIFRCKRILVGKTPNLTSASAVAV